MNTHASYPPHAKFSSLPMLQRAVYRAVRTMVTFSSSAPGPIERSIADKLQQELKPQSLVIHNDSHKHAGHHGIRGAENTTESHFRIEIVSDKFGEIKGQPNRHRLVYSLLKEEMTDKGVHALQLKTKAPSEV